MRKRELTKTLRTSKKIFKSDEATAKNRDVDIVNAARAILADFGIGKSDKTAEDYLKQMKEYDPDTYASVTNLIGAATEDVNFEKPTFDDFTAMSDAVMALWSFAKTSREIDIDGQKIDRAEVLSGLNARVDEIAWKF